MNIILLVLGAFLIIFSIVKIIISLNSREAEDKTEIKEETFNNDKEVEENLIEENIIYENITREEKPDFEEEYINIIDTSVNKPNMTDEIINMYEDGLTVNQIAKRLKKGIREIEIILKINKIKE